MICKGWDRVIDHTDEVRQSLQHQMEEFVSEPHELLLAGLCMAPIPRLCNGRAFGM